jgi:hypothetical protein
MRRPLLFVFPFLLAALTSSWSKELPFQIKVLSTESHQFQGAPLDPPNCTWRDISGYCTSSRPQTYIENKMVVLEADGKKLEIACTVYNPWSHCTSLPVNQTFRARTRKNGLEIRYRDQHGKWQKQVYAVLSRSEKEPS